MRSLLNLLLFLLFVNYFFHLRVINFVSSMHPLCRNDESYALLQFKESFIISKSASGEPFAYPKVSSWILQGETEDCCSRDGVECDEDNGHVIGLNLCSSCLYGSINSNSSLFQLVHLHSLILADNDFNHSEIPTVLSHLTHLRYLDLSGSAFAGQIPSEVSQLSNLVYLSLRSNSLKLQHPDLESLVRNLTLVQVLDLRHVQINSVVPKIFANLSSLTSLSLDNCSLKGQFPIEIFHLPNLRILSLYYNQDLTGNLPEFHHRSPLKILDLGDTSFYGELPFSIGNLYVLEYFDIWGCDLFRGFVPPSFGNLTKLKYLELSYNNFSVRTLSSLPLFGKLTKLVHLGLDAINLHGEIPSSIASLTNLVFLSMHSNQLTGQIPSKPMISLFHLELLDLSSNKLEGPIPSSIFELKNMKNLSFHTNNLSGRLELEMFSVLNNLTTLLLSFNNLTILPSMNSNASFEKLGLASCNLYEFPKFLKNQDNLMWLDLSNNHIRGQIPKWMLNTGIKTLEFMNLSYNSLTGFEKYPFVLPWESLRILDLRFNMLHGSLPLPSAATIHFYLASNNRMVGKISPVICSLNSLEVLDLSNNYFSGVLPQCLGNFSNSLLVINLQNNSFQGRIPQTHSKGCKLKMVDFSHNQLEGQVPRSLFNCKMLEFLDLGHNHIHDIFPTWLGNLPELRVLSLSSNEFQGALTDPTTGFEFSNIHIIDLSYNNFTGKLPSRYFLSWKPLKVNDTEKATYMKERIVSGVYFLRLYYGDYHYSLTIRNKGMERLYNRIPKLLKAIDFSYNSFEGEIPSSIGHLKGLHLLDLSHNNLQGQIPSTLGDFSVLESLDLSCNKLSRGIPPELLHLNFLAFFNVSHNHLTGPIPRGKQFDTFQNDSYEGNSGLCGVPLPKQCGNSDISPEAPSAFEKDQDLSSPNDFIWNIIAAMGYGSGLVIGVIIEHKKIFVRDWFLKTFRRRQQ